MAGKVTDINVKIDIQHTWNEDLNVTLISPEGTRIPLFEAVGGDGDNFQGTVLDAQAGTPIGQGDSPFIGTFKPQGNLNSLNGQDPNGTWTLEVEDTYPEDGGRINSFSVTITTDGDKLLVPPTDVLCGCDAQAWLASSTTTANTTSGTPNRLAARHATAKAGLCSKRRQTVGR